MSLTIEVGGKEYINFVSAQVTLRLDTIANAFDFQATSSGSGDIPFKTGESCRILVGGSEVMNGFIEVLTIEGTHEEHTIRYTGRSRTADLIDSTIAKLDDLKPPISLVRVCRIVMDMIGMQHVGIVDEAGGAVFTVEQEMDLLSGETGMTAFDFLEKLARKKSVLLSSNSASDLLLTRGIGTPSNARIVNRILGGSNNVMRYSASHDQTGRFNSYVAQGSYNIVPLSGVGGATSGEVVNRQGRVTDAAIRNTRQMVILSEGFGDEGGGTERAEWERAVRQARGTSYQVTVPGHLSSEGKLWKVNQLVTVDDDFCNLHETLLIEQVQFTLSEDDGNATSLRCVSKNSYKVAAQEPAEQDEFTF